jgi:hypothetical protein
MRVAEWLPDGGAMAAGMCQVTGLLEGNHQSVGRHIGACLPYRERLLKSSVPGRFVYSRELRRAPQSVKPKSRGFRYDLSFS